MFVTNRQNAGRTIGEASLPAISTRFSLVALLLGAVLLAGGTGMRAYASGLMAFTEHRLLAARPAAPGMVRTQPGVFIPADGPPSEIRLPDLGLWNALAPVQQQLIWKEGRPDLTWNVRDAGWYMPSGWPGQGRNVVIAGHSPTSDPGVWSRSVFRQLAYLAAGDRIELTAGSRIYHYKVSHVFAVSESESRTPAAAAWIAPGDTEQLTLLTCWPPHTAAYRVIVIAQPVLSEKKLCAANISC